MHSHELAPYLRVMPWYDYGFKPHIVSLRFIIDKEVLTDTGWVIDAPLKISQTFGPTNWYDNWQHHWEEAEHVKASINAPWDHGASIDATELCARFGYAAESYILATNPEADERHYGRRSKIAFKEVAASLSNESGHLYVDHICSFWENFGSKFRLFRGYLKNGTAGQDLVGAVLCD